MQIVFIKNKYAFAGSYWKRSLHSANSAIVFKKIKYAFAGSYWKCMMLAQCQLSKLETKQHLMWPNIVSTQSATLCKNQGGF